MTELLFATRDMLQAVRVFKQHTAQHDTGVPPGTLGVLAVIAAGRQSHVTGLAAECALDPSTISRAVAALVRAGHVTRRADPADGRASVLTITDAGRDALDQILARYADRFAGALHNWTPDELRDFSTMLRRFTHDLQEAAR